MDDILKKAQEFSHFKVTHHRQRELLRLKAKESLTHSINGGTFTITQELITFVGLMLHDGESDIVLIDIKENPIKIDDLQGFYDEIKGKYFEATNEWHLGWEKLRTARTVKAATEAK